MMRQCSEVQNELAACIDGQLTEEARAQVQAHLAQCSACQEEFQAQTAVKRQLQAFTKRQNRLNPPARIWAAASREWDRQDGRRLRRFQVRFAIVGAGLLLVLFTAVWARLAPSGDFPVDAVERDFLTALKTGVKPTYTTSDPDVAASWLREHLQADMPPIELRLSRAKLVGTDIEMIAEHKVGRLLYKTPQGLVGVYVAPEGVKFGDLPSKDLEGDTFRVDIDRKDIRFYGWNVGKMGYGLVTPASRRNVNSLLLDSLNDTEQPLR